MSVIDARLRYPFSSNPALPESHQEFLSNEVCQPYGNSMRQIIAMPMSFSENHPGAHIQLVDPDANLVTKASMVTQPFHCTALHRIFSDSLTEKTIREKIVPDICERLNEINASQTSPISIESHFDPATHTDAAHWEPDPNNMSIRFVSATTDATGPRKFFVRIESRSSTDVGNELHAIAERMTAREYPNDPRVKWSAGLQKRTIGRLLDICSNAVEKYTGEPVAERVEDSMAKVRAHEMTPLLAVHNGPMSMSNTARYIEPQFKTSDIPNDPRAKGMVGFYANCAGEVSKGALLEGNHNEPLYEMHAMPEIDPTVGSSNGTYVYRSPELIQNSVFGGFPSFQPRLSAKNQQDIVESCKRYPSESEAVQSSIVSLRGSDDIDDIAPYFSRFRTPTDVEMKTITCEMSKRAFGLSGTYQRYDPIVSIVP